ncbi:hypothetical protein [Candidatus Poriferisodalis sp.]|uniref:hypothetical protein n=1 Tax=Candidatus Poriferisodalis sp. TaxID=3101277 RepID=UPI003B51C909
MLPVAGIGFLVRADTKKPALSVFAPAGGDTVWVRSSEPLQAASVKVTLTRGRSRLTVDADVSRGDTEFVVTFAFPDHGSYVAKDLPFTEPPALHPGDKISIATKKLTDRAGNQNAAVTHTVAAPDGNEWAVERTAACDHSWTLADGTLVARLSASAPAALPHSGSAVVVRAGAARDLVGNPSLSHRVEGFAIGDSGFG